MNFTDTDLLDYLQDMTDKANYTGKVVFRWSLFGRGWRLHETSRDLAQKSVRQAIADSIEKEAKYEGI